LKKLLAFVLVIIFVLASAGMVFAGSEATNTRGYEGEIASEHHEVENQEAEHNEQEHHGVPVTYYIQWVLIASVFGVALQYMFKKIRGQKEAKTEGLSLAYVVVGLGVLIYGFDYPQVLMGYHEPLFLGYLRLLFLLVSGILVTIYGVLGRFKKQSTLNSH